MTRPTAISNSPRSQVIIEEFHSSVLEGNPLGDPATRRVPVYLPPNYDPQQGYPTLYLLSSFGSRGLKMLTDSLWEENIQERLDRLIGSGTVRPMLVVLPDASTRYGGSQYVNSSATGRYEDHILELVAYIDERYATVPERDFRAIGGHSSGGFAATRFGMRHADSFAYVADHSGDKFFDLTYRNDFPYLLRYYEKVGEEGLQRLLENPGEELSQGAPFHALALLATAACFSPKPEAALGFDLPIDLRTGQDRPKVWEKWLTFDPIYNFQAHTESLKSLNLLFIDCGSFDEYNLVYGARVFSEQLKAAGVAHRFEEFPGGHRDVRYRYDVSFQAISEAMPTP